ncbi:MAG: hypothetical protein EGR85_04215 [Subdoligranulum sp.]|nr:hypothetical protein [Subdoligranulum sp.]
MMNRKILAMAGVGAMMIGFVACGSKAESNIAESATPAPTAEAAPTPEPTEEPAESHDFDLSVNKYKSESNIEIKQYSGDSVSDTADCDSGTDIEEPDTLYDWLYNNGVTRESVQNDRDSGCKNPYLEGYLEYLDSLVDKQIAEDNAGQVESSAKGDGLGGTEIIGGDEFILDSDGGGVDQAGVYYTPHQMEGIKQAAEKQEANKAANEALIDQMHKDSQEMHEAFNDQQKIQDFVNRLQSNG